MMENVIQIISTVGFPIAITLYLLYERDKTTKALIKVITELKVLIKARLK